jgi:serine/threonine-protein kinase
LSGRSPLERLSRGAQAQVSAMRFRKIVPLKPADVEGPPSLFRLLDNMMALQVDKRIQTPAQLVESIRACRLELATANGDAARDSNKQATIFIAESDEKLQDLLRTKLKAEGYRVLLAADPVRALDRFRQQPFDLLIVDAATTGENGCHVFERIMEDAQRHSIACRGILMLNAEQTDWQKRAEGQPGIATLTQPIKYKQLLQAIRGLLRDS